MIRYVPQSPPRAPRFARLRILWSFARPHRRRLLAGLALALAGSATALASPLVTKWVLDSLGSSASLTGPIAALLVLLVVGVAIWWRQWTLLGMIGEQVVLDARTTIVRRYLGATVPAVAGRPAGELVTRATSDTVLLREAAASSAIGILNGAAMVVGTLTMMAVLDLVLFGVMLAAVVVVGALFVLLLPAIARHQERAQEHVGRVGGSLEGSLRAIRTIKASRAEERAASAILADAQASTEHSIRALRTEVTAWVLVWGGVQLAVVLVLAIGAWRAQQGLLEVSSLVAFLLYTFALIDPILVLTRDGSALQAGIAAAGRIREVDAFEREPVETTGPARAIAPSRALRAARDDEPVLELRDVTAAHGPGAPPAVRGVRLAIPRRGHVAIVGPSGAGKTTLFSLMLRFLEPQGGELRLGGRSYGELTRAQVRERIAYVEQDTPIVPGTVRENLLFTSPDATEEELHEALRAVRLEALAERLDLPLASAHVSGGERQRIALARAIVRAPELLLLDEATAQVDALTEAAIHRCIRARAATGAVVTIAHRLSTVVDADTIVVMEDGRVRAQGSHVQLLASDALYRSLVDALRLDDG